MKLAQRLICCPVDSAFGSKMQLWKHVHSLVMHPLTSYACIKYGDLSSPSTQCHATLESTAADVAQVKQMATALGLKGKGDTASLIEQIMKTVITVHSTDSVNKQVCIVRHENQPYGHSAAQHVQAPHLT